MSNTNAMVDTLYKLLLGAVDAHVCQYRSFLHKIMTGSCLIHPCLRINDARQLIGENDLSHVAAQAPALISTQPSSLSRTKYSLLINTISTWCIVLCPLPSTPHLTSQEWRYVPTAKQSSQLFTQNTLPCSANWSDGTPSLLLARASFAR